MNSKNSDRTGKYILYFNLTKFIKIFYRKEIFSRPVLLIGDRKAKEFKNIKN